VFEINGFDEFNPFVKLKSMNLLTNLSDRREIISPFSRVKRLEEILRKVRPISLFARVGQQFK
jgi:hypothetical protein